MNRGKTAKAANSIFKLSPLVLAMAGYLPVPAVAGIALNDKDNKRPALSAAANNTPVVNINNPDSHGLSHNRYQDFNVSEKGLIFNNSTKDGVSKIGGFVIKNDRLKQESRAILNEVTGAKGSYLNGAMEVFGRKADVIIANENGITVNGISTINTRGLTLSTGRVNIDDRGQVKLAVERGAINVEGRGINTDGLSYFDLISRSAQIKAQIAGEADLKIVTGLNDYDIENRTHQVRSLTGKDTPQVAIAGTALGSMYGNRIELISTESGAGVTHAGSLIGTQGIEISANGDIQLAGIMTQQGDVHIRGQNIALTKNADTGIGGIDAHGDIVLTALQHMTLAAGSVSEQGSIRINASTLLQSAASLLAKNGYRKANNIDAIKIKVTDSYTLRGELYAIDPSSGKKINNATVRLRNGKYEVLVKNRVIPNAQVVSDASLESVSGNLTIDAGSLQNQSGFISTKKGQLAVNLSGTLINNGLVQAMGGLALHGKQFKNDGIFNTTDDLLLTLGSLENSGALYGNAIQIDTQELANTGFVVAEKGDLKLDVSGSKDTVNSGLLQGHNNHLNTGGTLINRGKIAAEKALNINSKKIINHKEITSQQDIQLSAEKTIDNLGIEAQILAQKNLKMQGSTGEKTLVISNADAAVIQSSEGSLSVQNAHALNNSGTLLAGNNFTVDQTDQINNQHGLIQANKLQLNNLNQLNNNDNGKIVAIDSLIINNVESIDNDHSQIYSKGKAELQNIENFFNNAGQLEADGKLTLQNITTLENSNDAKIHSYYDDLLLASVTNLKNLLKSTISAKKDITLSGVNQIENAAASHIQTLGNINITETARLDNQGQILAGLSFIINNINELVNEGNGAVLQGLHVIFNDIKQILNQQNGMILAEDDISLTKINKLLNYSAGRIQGESGRIEAKEIINSNYHSEINIENSLDITADTLKNSDQARMRIGDKLVMNVDSLDNDEINVIQSGSFAINATDFNNAGIIKAAISSETSSIVTESLRNESGKLIIQGGLKIETDTLANGKSGSISASKLLDINLKGDFSNDDSGTLLSKEKLSITTTGDITIDRKIESIGSLYLNAKNITNKSAAFSSKGIYWTAINIINEANATIFAVKDITLRAAERIFNGKFANILGQNQIHLNGKTIHNHAGIIRAEGDMWLDAETIRNESTYTGMDWDTSALHSSSGEHKYKDGTYKDVHYISLSLPGIASDIKRDRLAEITAGGDMFINQTNEGSASLINEGGLIQSGGDMLVRGDIINAPKYVSVGLEEYLLEELKRPVYISRKKTDILWSKVDIIYLHSMYQALNFLFNDGSYYDFEKIYKTQPKNTSRSNELKALKNINGNNTMVEKIMSTLFGGQWHADSYETLREKWQEIIAGDKLKEKAFYLLPSEKATISAGGDFIHTGGALNNGIASELGMDIVNKVINVNVDGKEISTLEQNYDVYFNKKNIVEISMGISTQPVLSELININGLYQKSQGFYDKINNKPKVDGEPEPKFIPMYETRPAMNNKDDFYGSDYFFDKIGYTPEQPVIVIGDNYFISELIRRQINQSVGNYFQVKYHIEGAGLVKNLFDNVSEIINEDAFSSLEVGKKLTQEQINSLDKDIVWFVTEQVDGIDVLMPHIYLAQNSLKDIEQGSVTGAAAIHAGGNVDVAATTINNNNAVISAGNNVALTAEHDITSVSNGMVSGIMAGNDILLHSKHGDIANSGSQMTSGNDIALIADEGNVDIIASVGISNESKQQIGSYADDLTAGNNINIVAKEINITAVDLNAGDSADSEIVLKSTEGNVSFNDVHEVSSSYNSTLEDLGFLSHRMTETTTVDAEAKTAGVNTGGKLTIDAKKDAIFHGGEYNSGSGSIKAGNDVITTTSQDHHMKETNVTESSFVFGFSSNTPGTGKKQVSYSTLDGSSTQNSDDYESAGSHSELTNKGSKRAGAAPTAAAGGFQAGLKTTTSTTKDSITTNKNAAFNFTNDAELEAKNMLDIGGMDLSVGESGTAALSAENIVSTKYNDTHKHDESYSETFVGIKGEVHSSVVDAANKYEALGKKSEQQDMSVNAGLTTAQVAGDASNLLFNDAAGSSVSIGWSQTKEEISSVATQENINHIRGGTINLSSNKDTALKGIDINANEMTVNTGGDFSLTAAESTFSEATTSSTHTAGVSSGGGVGLTGAGAGISIDYSGSNNRSNSDSVSYTNSSITANNVTVNSGNDMTLTGANIKAGQADVNVAGDLSIQSVQDSSKSTASSENWGVSVGVAISTSGVLPTVSAHGGGGSEAHLDDTVAQQSGIHTSGELNVKTGGDVNLTGSHLISDSQTGSVTAEGAVNAKEITDVIDSSGIYGGGGGGMSYKGTPMANGYVDTLDTIYREEVQHGTINLDIKKGVVNGKLNTDAGQISTVTEDKKEAGNNISFTVGKITKPGSKKKKNKPAATDDGGHSIAAPTPSKPGDSTSMTDGGHSTTKPAPSKPVQPTVVTSKPPSGHAKTENVTNNGPMGTGPLPAKPAPSKPVQPTVVTSKPPSGHAKTENVTNNGPMGTGPLPAKPTQPKKGQPGKTWPTVEIPKPVITSPGSSSGMGGFTGQGSVKPTANRPGSGTHTEATRTDQHNSAGNAAPMTAKKWPTVQPPKPITTSAGSSGMGGFTGQGTVKPAANATGGGTPSDVTRTGQQSKTGGVPAAARSAPSQSAGTLGTMPGVAGVFKANPASNTHSPAKTWPTVHPNTTVVSSIGSSGSPGLFNGKPTANAVIKGEGASAPAKNQK
ncbi:hemagglutinin repeat-containing protein [Erwinia sp. D4-22]